MLIEPFYGFEIWEAAVFVNLAIEPDIRANLVLPQAPRVETLSLNELDHPANNAMSTLLIPRIGHSKLDFQRTSTGNTEGAASGLHDSSRGHQRD